MILFSFLFLSFINSQPTEFAPTDSFWLTNFTEATDLSKEKELPILMVFSGSDWCKPCIKLRKEVFDNEKFISYADQNLILLHLDFPRYKKNRLPSEIRKHHDSIAETYNPKGQFPLVLILDKDGNTIASTGYQSGGVDNYISHLQSLTQSTDENP